MSNKFPITIYAAGALAAAPGHASTLSAEAPAELRPSQAAALDFHLAMELP